jgi:hypothetical protein
MEYFLQVRIFRVEIGSLCAMFLYPAELKKHIYLSKETLYVISRNILHICPLRIDVVFLKEFFLPIRVNKVDKGSFSSK